MKLPSGTTARAVDEWIGKTPNSAIPKDVQIRIFLRHGGKDAKTGVRLYPGKYHCDHIKPLWKGGEHRESNLQPLSLESHKEKTKDEAGERAKIKRLQQKHFLPKPKGKIPSRKFNKPWVDNTKFIGAD